MNQTICLVDDNADILEIFAVFFERRGYHVQKASGGQECLDAIRSNPPDLIILDVMMEPVDGWNTLEQIKFNRATSHIPVVIISGKRLTAEELKRYGPLFVRYIMKPFSLPVLNETVTEVIKSCGTVKM